MTPTELGFLASIITNRGDDTTRLAYADWLDERGGPGDAARAEFIRIQCEKEGIPEPPPEPERGEPYDTILDKLKARQAWRGKWSPRYYELRERERNLLFDHEWNWLHAISSELHRGSTDLEKSVTHWLYPHVWRRGFLAELTINAEAWSEIADSLAWHLGEMKCLNCEGMGVVEGNRGFFGPCPDCGGQWEPRDDEYDLGYSHGTGRAIRSCPPTAQPIEKVTITSGADDEFCLAHNFSVTHQGGKSVWTSPKWPGVEFRLSDVRDYRPVEEAVRQIRG